MKRLMIILASILFLTGCGSTPADRTAAVRGALMADCAFTADFTYETLQGSAEVEKKGDTFSVKMLLPEALAGLSFCFEAESLTITCDDMAMTLPRGSIPQEALVSVLRRVTGGEDTLVIEETNGLITATADQVFFHCIAELDAETLTPQRITVPELSIEIILRDYSLIKS